jgi:acetyltransferase
VPASPTHALSWTRGAPGGDILTLRRLAPADLDGALAFVNSLSFGDSYFRFGHPGFQISEADMRRQCHADPLESQHYIVALARAEGERVIAAADCCLRAEPESCEFALLVAEDWRRRGIARWLLDRLVACAREQGARRLVAKTLSSNAAMLRLARRAGFELAKGEDDKTVTRLVLHLDNLA